MASLHHWVPLLEEDDSCRDEDEVQLVSQVGVGLYALEEQVGGYQACRVVLTTHRVLVHTASDSTTNPNSALDLFLPLNLVVAATPKTGFGSWSHPKIILSVSGDRPYHYKLSFRMGGDKSFIASLHTALAQRNWMRGRRRPAQQIAKPLPLLTELPPPTTDTQTGEYTVAHSDNVGISRVLAAQQRRTEEAQQRLRIEPTSLGHTSTRAKLDAVVDDTKRLVQAIADARSMFEREGGSRDEEQRLISVEAALGIGSTAKSSHHHRPQYICELSIELLRWLTHKDNTLLGRRPVLPVLELFSAYNAARSSPVSISEFWDALCVCTGERMPAHANRGGTSLAIPDVVQTQIRKEHRNMLDGRRVVCELPVRVGACLQVGREGDFIAERCLSVRRYPSMGVAVVCAEPLLPTLAPMLLRQLGECDPACLSQTTPAQVGACLGLDSLTAYAVLCDIEASGLLCRSVVGTDGAAGWLARDPSYFSDDSSYASEPSVVGDEEGGPLNTAFHWNLFGVCP